MDFLRRATGKGMALGGLFFLLLISLGSPAALAAFGVSPPYVNAVHLVPGATYSQVIYLVQDQVDQDISVKADLKLQDPAKSWVSIDPGFAFVIPKGTRQFPVTVSITVPKDAALGVYNGTIDFVGAPSASGQVTIALGVQVSINLTVGNDIYRDFSVPYIKVLDIEEGWNPRVLVRLQNNGNVAETLDGATFELYDQYNSVRLAYAQLSSGLPQVPAFTTKEYTVEFPTDLHLGLGQYWGLVTFYQNGQAIGSDKGVFNVLPAGSLSSPLSIIVLSFKEYWIYYLLALVILALIVRRFWGWRRRR
jgi:hypothetical protein